MGLLFLAGTALLVRRRLVPSGRLSALASLPAGSRSIDASVDSLAELLRSLFGRAEGIHSRVTGLIPCIPNGLRCTLEGLLGLVHPLGSGRFSLLVVHRCDCGPCTTRWIGTKVTSAV